MKTTKPVVGFGAFGMNTVMSGFAVADLVLDLERRIAGEEDQMQ